MINKNNIYRWLLLLGMPFLTVAHAKQEAQQAIVVRFEERPTWQLQLAHDGPVIFHGVISNDQAGNKAYSMMYPANSSGELFVGIFIHGMIESSKRKAEQQQIIQAADVVLSNYQDILAQFTYQELITAAASSTHFGEEVSNQIVANDSLLIDSSPSYLMTQDQKTLVLNNYVKLGQTEKKDEGIAVRVVSSSINAKEPNQFWHESDGEALKAASADLLSQSINLALKYGEPSEQTQPFKTVRYLEGSVEKVERAQVLHQDCSRLLLRNLRGMIMSVPISPKMLQPDCKSS